MIGGDDALILRARPIRLSLVAFFLAVFFFSLVSSHRKDSDNEPMDGI